MAGDSSTGPRGEKLSPTRKVAHSRYQDIASTIFHKDSSSDIEELFINSARDGALERLQNFLNRRGDKLVSVDLKDKRTGNTALIWAAKRGHLKITQLLLRHGADITVRNYDGQSALEVASPVIKQVLLDSVEKGGSTPSHTRLLQAAWLGNTGVVHSLLTNGKVRDVDCTNDDGFTPLLLCTRDIFLFEKLGSQLMKNYNPLAVIQELIAHRADTSAQDNEGKTALHYCASSKATGALDLTNALSKYCKIDQRDRRSLAPLHYACQAGNEDIVLALIDSGADVNSEGFAGTTPLHISAYNNHERVAMILLEQGADVNKLDDRGQSSIDIARCRRLRVILKSFSAGTTRRVELAPVRPPSTPRRQSAAPRGRGGTVIFEGLEKLERSNTSGGLFHKRTPALEESSRGYSREGIRKLGAPRTYLKTNSQQTLAPIVQPSLSARCHSTSEVDPFAKKQTYGGSTSREDGVISVEVLGLSSADNRRRTPADAHYYSTSHDFIISNHGHDRSTNTASPSRLTPINTGSRDLTTPTLTTIHENVTLPRAVMVDLDNLRGIQGLVQSDENRHNSPPADGNLSSILKSEFVLNDSRTVQYQDTLPERMIPTPPSSGGRVTPDRKKDNQPIRNIIHQSADEKQGTLNRLQTIARENASKRLSSPASNDNQPITAHQTIKSNSGGTITMINDILNESPGLNQGSQLNVITAQKGSSLHDTISKPVQQVSTSTPVPVGIARQKTIAIAKNVEKTMKMAETVTPSTAQPVPTSSVMRISNPTNSPATSYKSKVVAPGGEPKQNAAAVAPDSKHKAAGPVTQTTNVNASSKGKIVNAKPTNLRSGGEKSNSTRTIVRNSNTALKVKQDIVNKVSPRVSGPGKGSTTNTTETTASSTPVPAKTPRSIVRPNIRGSYSRTNKTAAVVQPIKVASNITMNQTSTTEKSPPRSDKSFTRKLPYGSRETPATESKNVKNSNPAMLTYVSKKSNASGSSLPKTRANNMNDESDRDAPQQQPQETTENSFIQDSPTGKSEGVSGVVSTSSVVVNPSPLVNNEPPFVPPLDLKAGVKSKFLPSSYVSRPTSKQEPFSKQATFQPLSVLTTSKLKQPTAGAPGEPTVTKDAGLYEEMQQELTNTSPTNSIPTESVDIISDVMIKSPDSGISSTEKTAGTDKAVSVTFSQHQGPVIEDIFENYPRPLYEFAAVIAQDLADARAANAVTPKKKKKKLMKSNNSRQSSAVKGKRGSKGNLAVGSESSVKKRVKSGKKRKGKAINAESDETCDPTPRQTDNTALISGDGWHIQADKNADVDIIVSKSSDYEDGATTGEESDGESLSTPGKTHRRVFSFDGMSPRQQREELKNILLSIRSVPQAAMPETMLAIHDFANAVPSEHDLNKLFGLDQSTDAFRSPRPVIGQGQSKDGAAVELNNTKGLFVRPSFEISGSDSPTESLPDVSELAVLPDCNDKSGSSDEEVAIHPTVVSTADPVLPARCASTAMSVIIDEIMETPRSEHLSHEFTRQLSQHHQSPRRRLPENLLKEIHEEWEKVSSTGSQSHSLNSTLSNSSPQQSVKLGTSTTTEHFVNRSNQAEEEQMVALNELEGKEHAKHFGSIEHISHAENDSDEDSMIIPEELLYIDSSDESDDSDTPRDDLMSQSAITGKPPAVYRPRSSRESPAPKSGNNSAGRNKYNRTLEHKGSAKDKKGTLSFSEVSADDLPPLFPCGSLVDQESYTNSLTSEIRSRPNSRTYTSQLGGIRRSSIKNDTPVAQLSHRSSGVDDSQILQWKKGNMLGKGAFGTVYCGLTSDGHLIAVKQIELNVHDWDKAEKEYEGIQEEVELLKNLTHDNIVGFLGTSLDDNVVSIYMQFVPGGTIASLLSRFGAFEENVFRKYTLQMVNGVEYLHANDVIHRDIKGANVMLMSNGVIKLIDFGCAKRLCLNLSVSQGEILKSMKGTPYWMAPEVIKETGHGKKSDIWSIGCTVFEMATSKPPWAEMQPMAAIFAIGSDRPVPPLPGSCSPEAREFVRQCMQRDQSVRLSASQLLQTSFLNAMM